MEPRIITSSGMCLCTLGLTAFSFLTPQTDLILIIGSLMFMGLGFAPFSSPNTNAIMSSVDRYDYGVASDMASTMRLLGQMMNLGIASLIFTRIMGHVAIVEEKMDLLMDSTLRRD